MDMLAKLPEMAEDALTTLGVNAERLVQTGTPKQQKAANALLPAIQAEIAARRVKKLAETSAARPRRKTAVKAAKAVKADTTEDTQELQ